jgi:hypothetical protein
LFIYKSFGIFDKKGEICRRRDIKRREDIGYKIKGEKFSSVVK